LEIVVVRERELAYPAELDQKLRSEIEQGRHARTSSWKKEARCFAAG